MTNFEKIERSYYEMTIFALAHKVDMETITAELEAMEREQIYGACSGIMKALNEWNEKKSGLNCSVNPATHDPQ